MIIKDAAYRPQRVVALTERIQHPQREQHQH